MLKNTIILILAVIVILFWVSADSYEDEFDNLDSVIIEYNCSALNEYEDVPPEVIRECKNRIELTKNRV
jgi:hypothetical protein